MSIARMLFFNNAKVLLYYFLTSKLIIIITDIFYSLFANCEYFVAFIQSLIIIVS